MKKWELVAIIGVGAYEIAVDDMEQEEIEAMRGRMEVSDGVRGVLKIGSLLDDPDWDVDYKEGFDTSDEARAAMDALARKILDGEAFWFGYASGDFECWTWGNERRPDESDAEYFARWAEEFDEAMNAKTYSYFTAIIMDRETQEHKAFPYENPVVGYGALMDAYERAEENGHPWTW